MEIHDEVLYRGKRCKVISKRRGSSLGNPLDQSKWGLYHDLKTDYGAIIRDVHEFNLSRCEEVMHQAQVIEFRA